MGVPIWRPSGSGEPGSNGPKRYRLSDPPTTTFSSETLFFPHGDSSPATQAPRRSFDLNYLPILSNPPRPSTLRFSTNESDISSTNSGDREGSSAADGANVREPGTPLYRDRNNATPSPNSFVSFLSSLGARPVFSNFAGHAQQNIPQNGSTLRRSNAISFRNYLLSRRGRSQTASRLAEDSGLNASDSNNDGTTPNEETSLRRRLPATYPLLTMFSGYNNHGNGRLDEQPRNADSWENRVIMRIRRTSTRDDEETERDNTDTASNHTNTNTILNPGEEEASNEELFNNNTIPANSNGDEEEEEEEEEEEPLLSTRSSGLPFIRLEPSNQGTPETTEPYREVNTLYVSSSIGMTPDEDLLRQSSGTPITARRRVDHNAQTVNNATTQKGSFEKILTNNHSGTSSSSSSSVSQLNEIITSFIRAPIAASQLPSSSSSYTVEQAHEETPTQSTTFSRPPLDFVGIDYIDVAHFELSHWPEINVLLQTSKQGVSYIEQGVSILQSASRYILSDEPETVSISSLHERVSRFASIFRQMCQLFTMRSQFILQIISSMWVENRTRFYGQRSPEGQIVTAEDSLRPETRREHYRPTEAEVEAVTNSIRHINSRTAQDARTVELIVRRLQARLERDGVPYRDTSHPTDERESENIVFDVNDPAIADDISANNWRYIVQMRRNASRLVSQLQLASEKLDVINRLERERQSTSEAR